MDESKEKVPGNSKPSAVTIAEKTDACQKKATFAPSSLPAESAMATPSFKQLMTHVNAIKSSQLAVATPTAVAATSKQASTKNSQRNRRDSFSHLQSTDKLIKFSKPKTNERYSGTTKSIIHKHKYGLCLVVIFHLIL